ncbi:MAG: tRNA (N(6)-L-threonylcarbamoyladenosine(37)-C(2))-methylthiotransferase MtaB [Dehalococcoidia bacterium]
MATEAALRLASRPLATHPAPTVALLTIGCKLNQAESEAIAFDLAAAGCHVTDRPVPADGYIINTCSVTHVADRKSRHLIRLARRLSPQAPVLVTGCYVETATSDLLSMLGADRALPGAEKGSAVDCLLREVGIGCSRPPSSTAARAAGRLRTRSFVKIQEGCNDACAFCIVPRTRGRERSVPAAEIVDSLRSLEAGGVQEIVLTGTQLGAYGRDQGQPGALVELIASVLKSTSFPRLHLSSLQPQDVTPGLLDLWADSRLCPHFHIALQSGSAAVLAGMRRRYTLDQFRETLRAIRERLPDAAVTTDILVGFPGESDADFAQTESFCREAGFAALHVFPYSRRPGTLAAAGRDHVPETAKRARVQRMIDLGQELRDGFLSRFQGRIMTVLWETAKRPGKNGTPAIWEGLTDNYVRVFAATDGMLENQLLPVRLVRRHGEGFFGELNL